jgi:hypothetical protein
MVIAKCGLCSIRRYYDMRKAQWFWIAVLLLPVLFSFLDGSAVALTGGPDSYGYRYADSEEPGAAPFSWIDISNTGTDSKLENFDVSNDIPIGFRFRFYGDYYDTVRITSSGFITFKKTNICGWQGGETIPTEGGLADNMIAAFWDNLWTAT